MLVGAAAAEVLEPVVCAPAPEVVLLPSVLLPAAGADVVAGEVSEPLALLVWVPVGAGPDAVAAQVAAVGRVVTPYEPHRALAKLITSARGVSYLRASSAVENPPSMPD